MLLDELVGNVDCPSNMPNMPTPGNSQIIVDGQALVHTLINTKNKLEKYEKFW